MMGGSDMGDALWLLIFYDHLWAPIWNLNKRSFFSDCSKILSLYDSLPYTERGRGEGGSEMDNCCSFANWHLFRLQNVFVTICWLARMIIHKYQCSTINRWDDDCMEERTCCFEMAMADYWSAMAIGRWQLFGDRRNHFLRSRWQTARSPSAPSELWL